MGVGLSGQAGMSAVLPVEMELEQEHGIATTPVLSLVVNNVMDKAMMRWNATKNHALVDSLSILLKSSINCYVHLLIFAFL